ncbi:MAG: hypothetical protein PUF51_01880 [Bifidobacteriaceae bacterium]|nr:hypothetical protein [Bifidobacteriaceae bacterium]
MQHKEEIIRLINHANDAVKDGTERAQADPNGPMRTVFSLVATSLGSILVDAATTRAWRAGVAKHGFNPESKGLKIVQAAIAGAASAAASVAIGMAVDAIIGVGKGLKNKK